MSILNFFKKTVDNKVEVTEEGLLEANVCPNCWGHHEYGAEFTPYVEALDKDFQSKDRGTQKAFIMKFVEERITGITLKRESGELLCPACSEKYPA